MKTERPRNGANHFFRGHGAGLSPIPPPPPTGLAAALQSLKAAIDKRERERGEADRELSKGWAERMAAMQAFGRENPGPASELEKRLEGLSDRGAICDVIAEAFVERFRVNRQEAGEAIQKIAQRRGSLPVARAAVAMVGEGKNSAIKNPFGVLDFRAARIGKRGVNAPKEE